MRKFVALAGFVCLAAQAVIAQGTSAEITIKWISDPPIDLLAFRLTKLGFEDGNWDPVKTSDVAGKIAEYAKNQRAVGQPISVVVDFSRVDSK